MSRKLRTLFAGWARKKDGTTAIEFSLMAIPYIFLTVGILELAVMYASASLLEGATASASRLIRTGQMQQSGADPEAAFREALCDYAAGLIDCDNVLVEAMPLASFGDYDAAAPQIDEDGNMVSRGFDPGGSGAVVLIRVSYRYSMMTPFVGVLLAGPSNTRRFMSTIVLQTEPYEDFEGS